MILCLFHGIKIKFAPLQAEEMLFVCQPHALALLSVSQAGWVFSHPGIGVSDQRLIRLNCNADCRGNGQLRLEPQKRFGNTPCFQHGVCGCALASLFSPLSTL